MTNDDEQRTDRKIIRTAREEAAAAVRQFNRARVSGNVTLRVRRDLADAALNYYDALHDYRDEEALREPWEERGIIWLEEAASETVTVQQSLPRANGATKSVERRYLLAVDPAEIRDTIRELHDVAKELGFSPKAKQGTVRTEIGEELIEEVEEWRQNNLA